MINDDGYYNDSANLIHEQRNARLLGPLGRAATPALIEAALERMVYDFLHPEIGSSYVLEKDHPGLAALARATINQQAAAVASARASMNTRMGGPFPGHTKSARATAGEGSGRGRYEPLRPKSKDHFYGFWSLDLVFIAARRPPAQRPPRCARSAPSLPCESWPYLLWTSSPARRT